MSFEAKDYTIADILTNSVFEFPRNQRHYAWKQENWTDLYNDIIFSVTQKKSHFIGSIVLKGSEEKDGISHFLIIDGQQRIMTTTLFLLAIMKHFQEYGMANEFTDCASYLLVKNNLGQDLPVLSSNYHTSLTKLITGMVPLLNRSMTMDAFLRTRITSAKDQTLGDAIAYFYHAIQTDLEALTDTSARQERLNDIHSALLGITAVRIVASSEEDAYTIFEILNARGQDLAAHELLKNHFMRYILPDDHRVDVINQWADMENKLGTSINRYVKHYAVHRWGNVRKEYGSSYKALRRITREDEVIDLFDDLMLKANYYRKLIRPDAESDCTETEIEVFSFFKRKRFELFRPILLSLMHQKDLGNLSDEDYDEILRFLLRFFVCYTIIGQLKSNTLEDLVFNYAHGLEDHYSDTYFQKFSDRLKEKITYNYFENAFFNIGWSGKDDLYGGKENEEKVRIILEVLEKYFSPSRTFEHKEYVISHILPDDKSPDYSLPGNLVPLEPEKAKMMTGNPLSAYLVYITSGFTLTNQIAPELYPSPSSFNPRKRTQILAHIIYEKIFHYTTSAERMEFRAARMLQTNLKAIVIGINHYNDKLIPDLAGAVPDARDLQTFLQTKWGLRDEDILFLVSDKEHSVNYSETLSQIESFCQAMTNDQRLLFYFAGHGAANARGESLLAMTDSTCSYDKTLSITQLNTVMKNCKAKTIVRIFDACHSGQPLQRNMTDSRGFSIGPLSEMTAAMLSDILTPGDGWINFCACGINEVSHELNNHGIFTEYLLKGLEGEAKKGKDPMQIEDLKMYVCEQVPNKVKDNFSEPQNPIYQCDLTGNIYLE